MWHTKCTTFKMKNITLTFLFGLFVYSSFCQSIFLNRDNSRTYIKNLPSEGSPDSFITDAKANWSPNTTQLARLLVPQGYALSTAEKLYNSLLNFIPESQLYVEFSEVKTPQLMYYSLNLFKSIPFEFNSTQISNPSIEILDKFADFWKNRNQLNFTLEAHTDAQGTSDYNQDLAQRRANRVMKTLTEKGVAESNYSVLIKGESAKKIPSSFKNANRVNRRIDIYSF